MYEDIIFILYLEDKKVIENQISYLLEFQILYCLENLEGIPNMRSMGGFLLVVKDIILFVFTF